MGIRLTAPPAPKHVPQDQAVTVIRLIIPHAQQVPGQMNIVREDVKLIGNVTTWDEDGVQIETGGKEAMVIPLSDVPAQGVTMLKQLYEWVEAQAIAQGFIGAGTAEVLEAPVEP